MKSGWIINPRIDAALIVGLPVLLVPLLYVVQKLQLEIPFAVAVGVLASGHLLPTFLRTYADRRLTRLYPVRFFVIPPLLFAAFVLSVVYNIACFNLLVLSWGFWHGLMQTYGVGRIYQAKAGQTNKGNLDWYLCLAWFGFGMLGSEHRSLELLSAGYQSGLPIIAREWMAGFSKTWTLVTMGLSFVYVVRLLTISEPGTKPCVLKLVHYATSFSFWWVAMTQIANPIIAVGLWEIFHDVQYVAVTWAFGNRHLNGPHIQFWGRWLFSKSLGAMALYTAVILLFGSVKFLGDHSHTLFIAVAASQFLVACNVLHFYFDGFIWKIRSQEVAAAFNVQSERRSLGTSPTQQGSAPQRHAALWMGLAGTMVLLTSLQFDVNRSKLDIAKQIALSMPLNSRAHLNYGQELLRSGFGGQAYREFATAAIQNSHLPGIQSLLGRLAQDLGNRTTSVDHFRVAHGQDPKDLQFGIDLALSEGYLGNYEVALRLLSEQSGRHPERAEPHYWMGRVLAGMRRFDESVAELATAYKMAPHSLDIARHLQSARNYAADLPQ